jgi:hypothetical protein
MSAIIPLRDNYVSPAAELTAYEDALIAAAKRDAYGAALKVMQIACPDPIPNWAAALMCHLLVESLR